MAMDCVGSELPVAAMLAASAELLDAGFAVSFDIVATLAEALGFGDVDVRGLGVEEGTTASAVAVAISSATASSG